MAKYYKSTATTWNTANNWSTTSSSGVDNAGIPTSADAVIFDSGSGSCSLVTTTGLAASIDFTNYTHTLTMPIGINVQGNITLGINAVFAGAGILTLSNSGTLTSNGKVLNVPFAIAANATATIAGGNNWIMSNNVSLNTASVINTTTTEQFECRGISGSISNVLNTGGGTATYLLSGSATVTGGAISNLTINTLGTYSFGSFSYKTGTFTYTAGTVNFTTNPLTLNGSCTLNTGAIQFYDLNITSFTAGTVTINSTLNVTHNFTLNVSLVTSITFAGTAGFNIVNYINSMASTQAVILTYGNTYTITGSVSNIASTSSTHGLIKSSSPGNKVILNISSPATVSAGYLDITDIDCSGGRTLTTFKGTLSNTTNCLSYTDYQGTNCSTFAS